MSRLNFKVEAVSTHSRARAGRFKTLHNEVLTPLFMPVGTMATVRAQTFESLESSGSQILLSNTFHLLLRPGAEVFKKVGGIHKFMNWPKSVLTDSGGFQIFSLPKSFKLTEEGASFRSYVNGDRVLLTPELSIEMQKAIGSDIMMVLDQCVPSTSDYKTVLAAMELTHRWAKRSFDARGEAPSSVFGIVQGACFTDLRKRSAECLSKIPFDGMAIGGLAVGEGKSEREDITEFTAQLLPAHLPRYLMGVGTPIDLLEAVHRGVDMFDCILPTSMAQQGVAYTSRGKVELRRGVYKFSEEPLDPSCICNTCTKYSRAYLHHLTKVRETLGWQLLGAHNIFFYHQLMAEMRASILAGQFEALYKERRAQLDLSDDENPKVVPKTRKKKMSTTLGDYEVHQNAAGFYCIRQLSSGEVMHSVNDPEQEAKQLYVEQTQLVQKLSSSSDAPLVVWDVGLGAATNAMAAIRCQEELESKSLVQRPLKLLSFENNLDSFRLALKFTGKFKYLKHDGAQKLLQKMEWTSPSGLVSWQLYEGDFQETSEGAELPDVVFFDPFSFKTDSHLWTLGSFQRIFERCSQKPMVLVTYSASTAVRAALMAAGFWVAKGRATGPKAETTIALTPLAAREKHSYALLGQDWIDRWERSDAKFPQGLKEEDRSHFELKIRNHPSFESLSRR